MALVPLALAILEIALPKPLNKFVVSGFAIVAAIFGAGLTFLYETRTGAGSILATVRGLLLAPLAVALWSLVSGVAVVWQANRLADNHAFCVAAHDQSTPIRSLAQLRGLSFYTTATRWYFYRLLIVKTDTGKEFYNWPPRRMKFQKVENPDRFNASPLNACKPQTGYWDSLSVL